MTEIPSISELMTRSVKTIGEDIPLSKALEIMREKKIRHLPVQYGGKLVGVISDRDAKLGLSVHPEAKDLIVGDVMTEFPYAVSPDTLVDEVFGRMARGKYGCAIVVNDKGRAVGILTAVDALRYLSALYNRFKLMPKPTWEINGEHPVQRGGARKLKKGAIE